MVPSISWLSLSFTRTGACVSARWRRYLISSNVCSGALVLLVIAALSGRHPIISGACRRPQILAAHFHPHGVKPRRVRRQVPGVVADRILRSQIAENLAEGLIELCAYARLEHAPAGAGRDGGQGVLAAQ